jgi:hypothetical protein
LGFLPNDDGRILKFPSKASANAKLARVMLLDTVSVKLKRKVTANEPDAMVHSKDRYNRRFDNSLLSALLNKFNKVNITPCVPMNRNASPLRKGGQRT